MWDLFSSKNKAQCSAAVFTCDNGQDNTPMMSLVGKSPEQMMFCISQSRIPGYKELGQDCMATAAQGDWACSILCDGHDRDGLVVSKAICETLPSILLDALCELKEDQYFSIPEKVIRDAFIDCERQVCWTNEGICRGMFVKVTGGDWDGNVGYVGEVTEKGEYSLMILDQDGYHKPVVSKAHLNGAKFAGGSTCVCLIRNRVSNVARLAYVGDSRALIMNPQQDLGENFETCSDEKDGNGFPTAVATKAHNLENESEVDRLRSNPNNDFEVEGDFLVNPMTGFAIQPTRGFGDFDMYGTGYTSEPEVSKEFILKTGMVILVASDGVFDYRVWQDSDLVSFLNRHQEYETTLEELADNLYDDTLDRSEEGGYVDDISFFLYCPKDIENKSRDSLDHLSELSGIEKITDQESVISEDHVMLQNVPIILEDENAQKKGKDTKKSEKRVEKRRRKRDKKKKSKESSSSLKSNATSVSSKQSGSSLNKKSSNLTLETTDNHAASGVLVPSLDAVILSPTPEIPKEKATPTESKIPKIEPKSPLVTVETKRKSFFKKSKSMSSFYFRKNRPKSLPKVYGYQHKSRRFDQNRSSSLDNMHHKSKVQGRLSIKRDEGGRSFTDFSQFSLARKEFSSQILKDIPDWGAHEPVKEKTDKKSSRRNLVKAAKRSMAQKRSQLLSQESLDLEGTREAVRMDQEYETSTDDAPSLLPNENTSSEMLKLLLSRIAAKYGHNMEELEELARDINRPEL